MVVTIAVAIVVLVMANVLISNDGREFEGFRITMSTKKIKRWRNDLGENMKCLSNHVR